MTTRPGNFLSFIKPATILGAPTGLLVSLNNPNTAIVNFVHALYVTTATVGTRTPLILFYDVATNQFLQTFDTAANIVASSTVHITAMDGVAQAVQSGQTHIMALPAEFTVPPNSQMRFLDSAAVDANDTVALYVGMVL